MKKLLLILCLLQAVVGPAWAQSEIKNFSVNFDVDEYVLHQDDYLILNKLITECKKTRYCEIELYAHTDWDASEKYNATLSEKRAENVAKYLEENGVAKNRIVMSCFGESKPKASNISKTGKAENRRVELRMKAYQFKTPEQMVALLADKSKQEFKVNSNKPIQIKGKAGTSIQIPKNAFVDAKGKPVNAANVKIVLGEYLGAEEAIFNQLSTSTHNGEILESGGMFEISASLNGEPLQMKKGAAINVDMPSTNIKNDMQVFKGTKDSNGVTKWELSDKSFDVVDKNAPKLPHTKLNSAYLKSLIKPLSPMPPCTLTNVYKMVSLSEFPIRPTAFKPRVLKTEEQVFSSWALVILPNFIINRKMERVNAFNKSLNESNEKDYKKRLASFEKKLGIYRAKYDSIERTETANIQAWLTAHEEYIKQNIQSIEDRSLNEGIKRIIELNDDNRFTTPNPSAFFVNVISPRGQWSKTVSDLKNNLAKLAELKKMTIQQLQFQFKATNNINLDKFKYYRDFQYADMISNQSIFVDNNPLLSKMLKDAQRDITAKREKLGLADNRTAQLVYNTSLSSFGMYNCDKFNQVPQNQMANIKIEYKGEAQVSFYVPSIKSYIYADRSSDGYYVRLPKNTPVKMLVVGFDESIGPIFAKENLTFTDSQRVFPEPKPVKLAELKEGLKNI